MINEILGSYGEFATFGYLAFVVTIATTGRTVMDRTSDMFLVQKPTEIRYIIIIIIIRHVQCPSLNRDECRQHHQY